MLQVLEKIKRVERENHGLQRQLAKKTEAVEAYERQLKQKSNPNPSIARNLNV